MTDSNITDFDAMTADTEGSFQSKNTSLQSKIKERYACMVLQNSVDFSSNNSYKFMKNITSRKASAQCIGRTVNILSSQSTMVTQPTRRTSIQSILIAKNPNTQSNFPSELESTVSTEQVHSGKLYVKQSPKILNRLDNVLENSFLHNNSQDETFKKLIQVKLNSKSKFEERYGIDTSLKRERLLIQEKMQRKQNRSLLYYDSNNNLSSHSNSSTGCNGNLQDEQQIVSLNDIPQMNQIKEFILSPPLPQVEVKEKQARSKSVLTSDKLPYINKQTPVIREQSLFNQRKNSSQLSYLNSSHINNNSSFIQSSPISKQDESLQQVNSSQYISPQKLHSRKFLTPKRSPGTQRYVKNAIKFDENITISQEFFKLMASKDDSQHLQFIRINRSQIKQYLSTLYDSHASELLLNFVDYPQTLSFQNFLQKTEDFANASSLEMCLFSFLLYDINKDGYICNADLYNRWKSSNNQMGQEDVNEMVRYASNQLNKREQAQQTIRLLKQSQKKAYDNDLLTPPESNIEEMYELENSIISGNKQISLQRYRFLKHKNEIGLPEIKSRQYTWYTKCFQVQEHYSNVRIMKDEIRSFEEAEKKQTTKKIQFNKLSGDFTLNFDHFCEIFRASPPRIVYDMIASLTGYLFNHVNYPYTENVLLQNNMQIITSEAQQNYTNSKQQISNKSNILLQMEQKSTVECYKLQFSQMLTNQ